MKQSTKKFGKQKLRQNGNALVVRLPIEWLATHQVRVSDPLFSVLTLDEVIRVHLHKTDWSKATMVRTINNAPQLTIPQSFVDRLGLTKETFVSVTADVPHDLLEIERVTK